MDGQRRSFVVHWQVVARDLPRYGRYIERQLAQLGAEHPFIRTVYELIELDGEGGLFPSSRRGQMAGETYSLLDVAGEEEEQFEGVKVYDPTARRDSTAQAVLRVIADGEQPCYEVVRRYLWTGTKHTTLYEQIRDLTRNVCQVRYVVVDATGIGAGLASFLRAALGERVVTPFVFGLASKSKLGWDSSGSSTAGGTRSISAHPWPLSQFWGGKRLPVLLPREGRATGDDREAVELSRIFWRQVAACTYEVRTRWKGGELC